MNLVSRINENPGGIRLFFIPPGPRQKTCWDQSPPFLPRVSGAGAPRPILGGLRSKEYRQNGSTDELSGGRYSCLLDLLPQQYQACQEKITIYSSILYFFSICSVAVEPKSVFGQGESHPRCLRSNDGLASGILGRSAAHVATVSAIPSYRKPAQRVCAGNLK